MILQARIQGRGDGGREVVRHQELSLKLSSPLCVLLCNEQLFGSRIQELLEEKRLYMFRNSQNKTRY